MGYDEDMERTRQRLSEANYPMLKFNLVIQEADDRWCTFKGREVPFSNFVVGDLTDMAQRTEEFLTRLLGMAVKIETGEE